MKKLLFCLIAFLAVFLLPGSALADQGCCSSHEGELGCGRNG